jgi:hypothetical protein
MKNVLIYFLGLISLNAFAQGAQEFGPTNTIQVGKGGNENTIVDGVFVKSQVPEKKYISYEHVREADYVWAKRVWSYVDLREKFNYPLYYPHEQYVTSLDPDVEDKLELLNSQRYSLWSIIRYNVLVGNFNVFRVRDNTILTSEPGVDFDLVKDGYDFKYPVLPSKPINKPFYLNDKDYRAELENGLIGTMDSTVNILKSIEDPEADSIRPVIENGKQLVIDGVPQFDVVKEVQYDRKYYKSQEIVRYHLKTDWFFDKERSLLDHRIIAIAPVIYTACENKGGNSSSSGEDEGGEETSNAEFDFEENLDKLAESDKFKTAAQKKLSEVKIVLEKAKVDKDTLAMLDAELTQVKLEKYIGFLDGKDETNKTIASLITKIKDLEDKKSKLEANNKPAESESGESETGCYEYRELFWLYFPQMRPHIQKYYTYNDKNDAQWMSFDDLFWKTKYTQVVYKESNVYDRKIESYRKGIDALIESERIKEEIRTFEHDVWNF